MLELPVDGRSATVQYAYATGYQDASTPPNASPIELNEVTTTKLTIPVGALKLIMRAAQPIAFSNVNEFHGSVGGGYDVAAANEVVKLPVLDNKPIYVLAESPGSEGGQTYLFFHFEMLASHAQNQNV